MSGSDPADLELTNQSTHPDYYAAYCVIKGDTVRFFNTANARRDAWKYCDKKGGVVMVTLARKDGKDGVKVVPDERPEKGG